MPIRSLPARPDPDHLRHQAKHLLRAFQSGAATAAAEFGEFHPEKLDASSAQLSDAHLVIARSYGASSWPQLLLACQLIDATTRGDFDTLRDLVAAHPEMLNYWGLVENRSEGWRAALSQAASSELTRIMNDRLRSPSVSGGREKATPENLRSWMDTMRLLGSVGGHTPRDAASGAGAPLRETPHVVVAKILEGSSRNPSIKHRMLETAVARGVSLPDTPPMAVHRGRLDLLEQHLQRDPALLKRTFSHQEIWPPEVGCHADEAVALHGVPLAGATLLHMAVEFEELETAQWLLDQGMDVNVRADVDTAGFGGQTALFHCILSHQWGMRNEALVQLLLDRGANPNARASIRKGMAYSRDTSLHEYRDVNPVGLGFRFLHQSYVSHRAMQLIAERTAPA